MTDGLLDIFKDSKNLSSLAKDYIYYNLSYKAIVDKKYSKAREFSSKIANNSEYKNKAIFFDSIGFILEDKVDKGIQALLGLVKKLK